MAFEHFEDKNHLAMLAIPVILSMVIGFSGASLLVAPTEARADDTEVGDRIERDADGVATQAYTTDSTEKDDDRRRKELRKAVAEGDYEGFLAATAGAPFAEIMTEDAFNELVAQYHRYTAR